jgi:hypothetical protein
VRRISPAFVLASAVLTTFAAHTSFVLAAPAPPIAPPIADDSGVSVDEPAFGDMRRFMEEIGASDSDIAQLAAIAQVPLNPEFINPFGVSSEVARPEYLVPRLTATGELRIANVAQLAAPGGPLAAGAGPLGEIFYGQGLTSPIGDEWYLYAKTFTAPCSPTAIREYGIVAFDTTPLNGGAAVRYEAATSNLFHGGNVAYVLHADPQNPFAALRHEMSLPGAAQDFTTTNSNWMAICGGDTVIGLIPGDEWDGISDLRLFGYDVPIGSNGQAQASNASQMRVPGVAQDPQPVDGIQVIEVGDTSVTFEPTLEPTSEPSDQPTLEPTPESTAATATEPIATSLPTATAIAAAASLLPAPTPTFPVSPLPSAVPPTPPTVPTLTVGGIDPLILILLLGLGLIGLSILLFLLSGRETDREELLKSPKRTSGAAASGSKRVTSPVASSAVLSKPPARPCKDGDESWEPEGPSQIFVVRADGARTRVMLWTEPGIDRMEEWIAESASAGGRQPGDDHPSITAPEIDVIDASVLRQWFASNGSAQAAPKIDLHFEIQCMSRSIQCERRWMCQGGRWVATSDLRSEVSDEGTSVRQISDLSKNQTTNAMRRLLNKAKTMLDELKQAEADAEKAARCE